MTSGRPSKFSAGSSPQQASRFSGLRGKASPQQPSAPSSRQGSGQLRRPPDDRPAQSSGQASEQLHQANNVLSSQSSQPQLLSTSALRPQGLQAQVLQPQGSALQWQSNMAYSPQHSVTSQNGSAPFDFPRSTLAPQGSPVLMQQSSIQGVAFTDTPRFPASQGSDVDPSSALGSVLQHGSLQQPQSSVQQGAVASHSPSEPFYSSLPILQASESADQSHPLLPQDTPDEPQSSIVQTQDSSAMLQSPAPSLSTYSNALAHESSAASLQAEASSVPTGPERLQGRLQQPRTSSGMHRQGWFQNEEYDDAADPSLHNPRYCCMYTSHLHAVSSTERLKCYMLVLV